MNNQNKNFDDDISVVGGVDVTSDLYISPDDAQVPTDDLGQQLYWLQKMNPGVIKFRQADITKMDDATKQAMINSMQYALGNQQLKDLIS